MWGLPHRWGYFSFLNGVGKEDGFRDSSVLRMIHAALLASALLGNAPKFPNKRKNKGDRKGGKQGRGMADANGGEVVGKLGICILRPVPPQ